MMVLGFFFQYNLIRNLLLDSAEKEPQYHQLFSGNPKNESHQAKWENFLSEDEGKEVVFEFKTFIFRQHLNGRPMPTTICSVKIHVVCRVS
jgi:hypothetical protein